MVYKLYELTYDEVKIIDPKIDDVLSSLGLTKSDIKWKNILRNGTVQKHI